MATSIGDLLASTSTALAATEPDGEDADRAATALGALGRALAQLTRHADQTGRRQLVSVELAAACRSAAAQFTATPGRAVELAAVAADAITSAGPGLDADGRWAVAVAVEVARTAGVAASTAGRFAPYAGVPALRRVRRLTEIVRQIATVDPPPARAAAVLDAAIPNEPGVWSTPSDAAAALTTEITRTVRDGRFTVAAALTACAAAESVAERAAALAVALAGGEAGTTAWSPAPECWRALQVRLRRFDDGSRYAVPTATRLTDAALALHDSIQTIGTDRLDRAATEVRYAANQLPGIAGQVETALTGWVRGGRLFALARSLPRSEDRVTELLRNRAVLVRPPDLAPAVLAARHTQKLSAALAVELDRSASVIGRQPQPRLIRAHRALLTAVPVADRTASDRRFLSLEIS